ncbi:hypothetical protein roselon_00474 [Roseibacterium elongatum DSM 19469]|uniref:Uncharacterized protein n=1 Tax=Roseicyclus elongatus DSM 19469 TaxID=1294273 RepID=W8SKA6_9RHOB|nr:hypothetical protein [Roseibacterium elongatum]AHM02915.1 hypothetical protein roselon_00474 [Roseibacterium elongatum DSM 19469]
MSIKRYLSSDSGAVTVDWVVLTATLVGLGLAVIAVVSGGTSDLSSDVDIFLASTDISEVHDWAAQAGSGWGDFPLVNVVGFDMAHYQEFATRAGTTEAAMLGQLNEAYQAYLAGTWPEGDAIDAIGATQAAMLEAGYALPEGMPAYAELYQQNYGS